MKTTQKLSMLLSATLFSLNAYALSPNALEGEELYIEANCNKCHSTKENYDPKNKKVETLSNLKGWTSSCATHFSIGWFPEEEELVNLYMNEIYYKLK